MKARFWIAPVCFALISGCDSGGTVNVSTAPRTPVETPRTPIETGGQPVVVALREVFFSLVALDPTGSLQQAKGVAFLPLMAGAGAAFELDLPGVTSLEMASRALYSPYSGGIVTAISSADSPAADLRSVTLGSLSEAELFQAPSGVRSVAGSGAWIAWLDLQGKLNVWMQSQTAAPALPGEGLSVAATDAGHLAVVVKKADASIETDFLAGAGGSWQQIGSAPSDRAAESPDGSNIAWITEQGSLVFRSGQTYELPSGARVSELSFADNGNVLLVERSGSSVLTQMSEASGARETLAALHLNSADPDGVVCPTAASGSVFFADRDSGTFVIERVSSGALVQPFARSARASLGYVCPKVAP